MSTHATECPDCGAEIGALIDTLQERGWESRR